ncbi:MAG: PaaI family thioesterase [Thermoplasmata archaeon]|jgi:uncharacterized protein (TIGR00369 family)|nr:PaaI family thioesterase [Thermoplasmatales archaeon]PMP74490.1 MAG: esterase [Aciduliprofundum sp.]HEU13174.1 PaaI family thioesterase [Euryarchaeota archaeon]
MEYDYEILKKIIESDPFLRHVGIRVLHMEEGYAKLSMDFREEITRIGGIANGGALATLADAAGGTSVLSLREGKNQVTVNLSIDFLEPVDNGPVTAEANVVRRGKNLVFSEIKIKDGRGRLCARASGIWFFIP